MTIELDFLLSLLATLFIIDCILFVLILVEKRSRRRRYITRQTGFAKLQRALLEKNWSALQSIADRKPRTFTRMIRLLLESSQDDDSVLDPVRVIFRQKAVFRILGKDSTSSFLPRRLNAYLGLGVCASEAASCQLLDRLSVEKHSLGRIIILKQLARHSQLVKCDQLLPVLRLLDPVLTEQELEALAPLAKRFLQEANCLSELQPFEGSFDELTARLFMLGSRLDPSEARWKILSRLAEIEPCTQLAIKTMMAAYPPSWFLEAYAHRREVAFLEACAAVYGAILEPAEIAKLYPCLGLTASRTAGIKALVAIEQRNPEEASIYLEAIATAPPEIAAAISVALEYRLAYYVHKFGGLDHPGLHRMLASLLAQARPGSIVALFEENFSKTASAELLVWLRQELVGKRVLSDFFSRHLDKKNRDALKLEAPAPEPDRPKIPVSMRDKLLLIGLVVAALCLFPLAFWFRWQHAFSWLTNSELLYRFIYDFHFLFAWYTLTINLVYLGLLILSAIKLARQSRLWEVGLAHSLYSSGMLPGVTIIAPAFNEALTIADSVESLLSLAYPDCQIVVVNDGSTDATMAALQQSFKLVATTPGSAHGLPSMPVRTVFRSLSAPNLLVVDKVNGGKADALNAGLNYANGEYVCCIDADSLLDPQALLRTMAQILASPKPVIAIGGNILPVNGSIVEHGHLQKIGLPRTPLAAFQTMEYLRSFVSGRLGWALLDGLLIISGAFGVFRKDRVLDAGGYMTGRGQFRKDTVGEDMELVVRLVRQEKEAGRDGTVDYCYNANCWTEVPENDKALSRQRDRWHRGLMEVLLHHRRMAGKLRYGFSGMVGLPYFFIFELIGPWIELSGYIVMVLSLMFGLINPVVSLTVFGISLVFGIVISLCSILLAERQVVYFRLREFMWLIFLALTENFGFRQVMSLSRVRAFVQFFYKSKGWQKFARTGFGRAGPSGTETSQPGAARPDVAIVGTAGTAGADTTSTGTTSTGAGES